MYWRGADLSPAAFTADGAATGDRGSGPLAIGCAVYLVTSTAVVLHSVRRKYQTDATRHHVDHERGIHKTAPRRHVREVDDPQLIGATLTSACSNTLWNQPAESRSKASFNFLSNELSTRLPQCHRRINSAQSLLYERAVITSRMTASTRNASTTTCNAEALCATRRSSTLVVA